MILTIDTIIDAVVNHLGIDPSHFYGKNRHPRVVHAREVTIYLCRELTTTSYPEIAKAMGRPNHSTLVSAYQRFVHRDDLWMASVIAAKLGPTVLGQRKGRPMEAPAPPSPKVAARLVPAPVADESPFSDPDDFNVHDGKLTTDHW